MKFWIYISRNTGMPLEVQKCDFQPTIGVAGTLGDWIEVSPIDEIWKKAAEEVKGWIDLQKKYHETTPFANPIEALREHKNQLSQLSVIYSKFLKYSGMESKAVFRKLIDIDAGPEPVELTTNDGCSKCHTLVCVCGFPK